MGVALLVVVALVIVVVLLVIVMVLVIILYNRKRGRTGQACGRQRWLDRSGRSGQGVRVVG